MKALRVLMTAWSCFCAATVLAEAGVLAVLWQRGLLTPQTAHQLLMIAYDVPLRDIEQKLIAAARPAQRQRFSFPELQEARMLAHLDLDVRDMAADKGLLDLRDLDALVEQEKNRYTKMKDEFDQEWEALKRRGADPALQEVTRQIESVSPQLAQDQLERILDDGTLDREAALRHVVTVFKGIPPDKRKKIVGEFLNKQSPRIHEILQNIRRGMPQATLIRDARQRLETLLREEG